MLKEDETSADNRSEGATRANDEDAGVLSDDLAGLITYIAVLGYRDLLEQIRREELTVSQLLLLVRLDEGLRPTIGQAARLMRLYSHTGASRAVDQLARRGLVRRDIDENSYRTKRIAITDRGRDVILRLNRARLEGVLKFSDGLTEAQRAQLQAAVRDCGVELGPYHPPRQAA